METRKTPTLEDVARQAGVSTATVSRCLNAPDVVLPETRRRVINAVDRLGYTPHFAGRALASNRSNTIGAVIPTMENAIFARGLQAFQEALAAAGANLLVASSGYDPEREAEQVRALVTQGADGLLLIGAARPQSTYDFLRARHVPYVIAWNHRPDTDHCYVGFSNREAARALTNHVLGYGHTRLAMIAGLTQTNDRASDRVAGVGDALAAAGQLVRLPVLEVPYTIEEGASAFAALIKNQPPPTAVICGNDVLAAGAIAEAKRLGLAVPADISIVGFDDIELARVVDPKLTTVHVPHQQMGHAAAEVLLQLRNDPLSGSSIKLETRITERESLARPPA